MVVDDQQMALLQYQCENLYFLNEEILWLQERLSKYEQSNDWATPQVKMYHKRIFYIWCICWHWTSYTALHVLSRYMLWNEDVSNLQRGWRIWLDWCSISAIQWCWSSKAGKFFCLMVSIQVLRSGTVCGMVSSSMITPRDVLESLMNDATIDTYEKAIAHTHCSRDFSPLGHEQHPKQKIRSCTHWL